MENPRQAYHWRIRIAKLKGNLPRGYTQVAVITILGYCVCVSEEMVDNREQISRTEHVCNRIQRSGSG